MTKKLWINLLTIGLLLMGILLIGFGIYRHVRQHPDIISPPVTVTLTEE